MKNLRFTPHTALSLRASRFSCTLTLLGAALISNGCGHAAPTNAAPKTAPVAASDAPYTTTPHPGRLQNMVFPANARIRNVKEAPFNAKGDGVTDDTAALQAAYNSTGLIYIPDGTYLVSGHIEPPKRKGKVPSRRVLQGQSTARTIIKLKDNAPGFGDPAKELSVFKVSYAPEQAFRNGVRNLTIDTGKGNPGAVGMQFYASNQGGMHHVHIRSGDGKGKIGLDLNFSDNNGPLLINDVSVEGFDTGIDAGSGHLITLEHIRVENQNKVGLFSQSYAFVRGFQSVQKAGVPAVSTRGRSHVTLIDAFARGGGEAAAVSNGGAMLVRNLSSEGYDAAIRRADSDVPGPRVVEWTAQPVQSVWPSPPRSLGLPIQNTPTVPWDDPKTWANVLKFGPKTVTVGKRKYFDVTEALQKAIDSGATTIYFPRLDAEGDGEKYHLLGTIRVRNNVRRIIGLEAEFRASPGEVKDDDYDAQIGKDNVVSKWIIEDGTAPVVVIERIDGMYGQFIFENRSKRTLVLSSGFAVGTHLAPGAGDLFIEDICMAYLEINDQNVWARQLNPEDSFSGPAEAARPNVRQNGGTFWMHGMKTEQNRTKIIAKNSAATEVSAFILANRSNNPLPMFITEDSRISVSVSEDVLRKQPFPVALRETRNGQTRDLTHAEAQKSGEGKLISLLVGDPGTGTKAPPAPTNLTEKAETSRVWVSWQTPAATDGAAPNGFVIERKDGAGWKPVTSARSQIAAFSGAVKQCF